MTLGAGLFFLHRGKRHEYRKDTDRKRGQDHGSVAEGIIDESGDQIRRNS